MFFNDNIYMSLDKQWKILTDTLIPHIDELKHKNQKKQIYRNLLKMFYLQMLKANESYIAHKHNTQIIHNPVENIHNIGLKSLLQQNHYFPENIINFITNETEFQTTFEFNIRKQHFKVSIYSYASQLQDSEHFKNLENYCRMIYTWFHVIVLYKRQRLQCNNINIHIFLTTCKKELPQSNATILGPKHVNSGMTRSCEDESSSIIIYRKDEWFKVLCHETFHHFNLDFHEINMLDIQKKISKLFHIRSHYLLYESYCEFWATLWNSMFQSFSYLNTSFKNFHKKYFQYIEDEKLFSCFQLAKIMHHNSLHYEDLLQNKNTRLYKEDSNVFAYYVIKAILLHNDDEFLKLLNSINKNILRFESSNDNVNSLCKFIKTYYNDDNFISKIKIFEKLLDNIDHKKIPNSLKPLFSTLNMTLYMN